MKDLACLFFFGVWKLSRGCVDQSANCVPETLSVLSPKSMLLAHAKEEMLSKERIRAERPAECM